MADPMQDIGGNDALAFANDAAGESGPEALPWDGFSDTEDTEDPTGKGKKIHPSQVFMYKPQRAVIPKRVVHGGNAVPLKKVLLTPGARDVDVNTSGKGKSAASSSRRI